MVGRPQLLCHLIEEANKVYVNFCSIDNRDEWKQNTTSQTKLETLQTSTIKARNAEQKLDKRRSLETPLTTEYFCFLFFLLVALYNYNGLVAPRLSLCNFWFLFVFWVCSLQLFRMPCASWEGYSTNLQGLVKTRPRAEISTSQHRSGRTYH